MNNDLSHEDNTKYVEVLFELFICKSTTPKLNIAIKNFKVSYFLKLKIKAVKNPVIIYTKYD